MSAGVRTMPVAGLVGDVAITTPEVEDDAVLVRRAAEGTRIAFAELVRRHQGKVRGLLLRLCGDRTLADDLAQEVFLRAYRGLCGFEGRSSFSTWLYRISYNAYLNHSTRTRRWSALPSGYDTATAAPDDACSPPRSDLRRDLDLAVATLPERYRGVVVLYYMQDLSYPEIAEILELPLGTVKTHLHRAKRLLRTKLHGWDAQLVRADDLEDEEGASSSADDVRTRLADLDVPAATLRRDPSGRTWLGEPALDPEAKPAIARFVAGERALFDDADVGADPLFTARVLASLPQRPVGAELSARRRWLALGGGYLAAAVVGWLVLDSESATVSGMATAAHGAIDALEGVSMAVLVGVLIAAALAAIALFARTAHTEPA